MQFVIKSIVFFILLSFGAVWADQVYVLDFEGLKDQERILNFYNGGTGSKGSSGGDKNYRISFGKNALSVIEKSKGGNGNFTNAPSGDTVMFFLQGSSILNIDEGFTTGFSFSYSNSKDPSEVIVYSGLNKTGQVLATVSLPLVANDKSNLDAPYNVFERVGVSFPGTARSIDFSGTANYVGV